MAQTLTLAERETIIRFSDDPADLMTVETFHKKHALRLIGSGATVKRTSIHGGLTYWTLEMPKGWFRWPRALSTLRSTVMRERFAKGLSTLPKKRGSEKGPA